MSGVYQIRVGSLYYVGCSMNIHARVAYHTRALRRNHHPNKRLQMEFNSTRDVCFDVLEEHKGKTLPYQKEMFWINYQIDSGKTLVNKIGVESRVHVSNRT